MRRLAVALALVAAVLAPMLSRADVALACSLVWIEPADRVARLSEWSEAIVVGEVVEEQEVRAPGPTLHYESRVRVVAVLGGDPAPEIRLADLGQLGADCSGGPRLVEGERVLLFLTQRDARGRATGEWRVTGYQGKYAFEQGVTYMFTNGTDVPAGSAGSLLAEVAAVNASDPAEVDRALTFALASPLGVAAERDDGGEEVAMNSQRRRRGSRYLDGGADCDGGGDRRGGCGDGCRGLAGAAPASSLAARASERRPYSDGRYFSTSNGVT